MRPRETFFFSRSFAVARPHYPRTWNRLSCLVIRGRGRGGGVSLPYISHCYSAKRLRITSLSSQGNKRRTSILLHASIFDNTRLYWQVRFHTICQKRGSIKANLTFVFSVLKFEILINVVQYSFFLPNFYFLFGRLENFYLTKKLLYKFTGNVKIFIFKSVFITFSL